MDQDLVSIEGLMFLENEPLAKYTAARLGGPADMLVVVKTTTALLNTVRFAHQKRLKWIILGGGTNVLISDKGFRGLVIINHAKDVTINEETGEVIADAGTNLSTLARRCMAKGLKGLEWSVSVPGSVGGAVVNNAGAHGSDIASNLSEVVILDLQMPDLPQYWLANKLKYDYRYSVLKGNHGRYLVVQAVFQLEQGHHPQDLTKIADEFVKHRKATQPPGASLGSIFKNPYGDYAGRLIEVAGLKGYRMGGVQVSPVHGNFFVNDENGTATEYNRLINYVQDQVLQKTGVALEVEVERIGEGF